MKTEDKGASQKGCQKKIRLVIALVVVIVLVYCGVSVIGAIRRLTPSYKATATARAIAEATEAARPTDTPKPTDTPVPTPLPTETPFLTDTSAPSQLMAKVTTSALNVRTGPGIAYPVVGQLNLDNSAKIVGKNAAGDWLQIVYPADSDGRAWIAVDYTDMAGSLAAVPEVSAPPTPAASPTPEHTDTPEPTPTSNWAGATKWLVQKEQKVGVTQVRFDHRIDESYGYYEADPGNVFLSLWIVGEHFQGDGTETFNPLDFGVADGAAKLHGHLLIPQLEPSFELCTVFVGGKCEGWLTFEVTDPQGVKGQLKLVWQPSWFDEAQMTEIEY